LFHAKAQHASLIPISGLVKAEDLEPSGNFNAQYINISLKKHA